MMESRRGVLDMVITSITIVFADNHVVLHVMAEE